MRVGGEVGVSLTKKREKKGNRKRNFEGPVSVGAFQCNVGSRENGSFLDLNNKDQGLHQLPYSSKGGPGVCAIQVKSRFTLLGGKIAICRGSGPDWRAGAGARVWSSLPPGLSKESGER